MQWVIFTGFKSLDMVRYATTDGEGCNRFESKGRTKNQEQLNNYQHAWATKAQHTNEVGRASKSPWPRSILLLGERIHVPLAISATRPEVSASFKMATAVIISFWDTCATLENQQKQIYYGNCHSLGIYCYLYTTHYVANSPQFKKGKIVCFKTCR